MFVGALKQIKIAILLMMLYTFLTGILYPLLITWIADPLFNYEASGSLIVQNGTTVGSELIGQSFTSSQYFWGRPSATTPYPYYALNSSGSNSGPSNEDFLTQVKARINTLRASDPDNHQPIPVDLVTASGSGLDAEISPYAAFYQVGRVAKARGLAEQDVVWAVKQNIKERTLGMLGEPRVNVLALNLALDSIQKVPIEEFFQPDQKSPS